MTRGRTTPDAIEEITLPMAKKKSAGVPPKLTEAEQDLLTHMEHGYQLETNSLGANPVLRQLKNAEVIQPPVRESQHDQSARGARPNPFRKSSRPAPDRLANK